MFRLVLVAILASSLIWGCGDTDGKQNLNPGKSTYKVSECGGFAGLRTKSSTTDYCDANTLDWSYDAQNGRVTLVDKRVLLNCCGERSVAVEKQGDSFVITELDEPTKNGRCSCECVFDFEVSFEVGDVPAAGMIAIDLVRDRSDDEEQPESVFAGKLDLSQGSGSEVLDETDVAQCGATVPPGTSSQTSAISECGGFAGSKSDQTYDAGGYCESELLLWQRDPQSGAVTFTDQRVELNCCGDRSITAADKNGELVITVSDSPAQEGRCRCMCVFDFAVTLGALTGKVPVKLVRDITEDNQPQETIYSGTLDLTADSGAVVVDNTPATFCQ